MSAVDFYVLLRAMYDVNDKKKPEGNVFLAAFEKKTKQTRTLNHVPAQRRSRNVYRGELHRVRMQPGDIFIPHQLHI